MDKNHQVIPTKSEALQTKINFLSQHIRLLAEVGQGGRGKGEEDNFPFNLSPFPYI
jgi:hypothetical protein